MRHPFIVAFVAALTWAGAAHAQGTVRGAEQGAAVGADAAGPVGGIVGGAVGAATGTVGGILGVDERPRFRTYVEQEHIASFHDADPVRVGTVLPEAGVRYYDVPAEYKVKGDYRYTVVNDRPVLVEPRTRRIVEVVE
jgi:hypothetical protein